MRAVFGLHKPKVVQLGSTTETPVRCANSHRHDRTDRSRTVELLYPIPEHLGYFATEDGRIFSTRRGALYELRQCPIGRGYRRVTVYSPTKKTLTVHHLMALTFLPPRPSPEHQMRHLDGCPSNNHRDNLVWGTSAENAHDRIAHGRQVRGERHGSARLCEADVRIIREQGAKGANTLHLARRFGVSRSTIQRVMNGVLWSALAVQPAESEARRG